MTDFHKAGGIKVSVYRHLKIQKLVRIFFPFIHYFSRFEFVKFCAKILTILEIFASFRAISYVFDSVSPCLR